ncbi:glycine zipper 2TM domain-containing protein [Rhodanobacter geophilus]|uniref:Glycine zipper 2TM domain-containing protein n=1 Tax=Rhodanobacter geophilus TaxID=3162488 RepID=A0ABV3QNS4_9GAMM
MPKLLLATLVLALVATGVQAQDARYPGPPPGPPPQDDNAHYGWADVLRVDPVYGVARTEVPRQVCQDQTVVQQRPGNTTAGSILGAVVGGVLGSTVGHGNGRTLSTAVGAVAGGAVGGQVAANSGSQTTQTVTNCHQVSTVSEQRQIMGYDVEYRYRGEVYESRLNYDPGERLRVRVSVTPAD